MAVLISPLLTGSAGAAGSSPAGKTTLERTVVGDPEADFSRLRFGPGQARVVREDLARAESRRAKRRRSLAYLGQLSDFQLADEESPARVEFFDSEPLVRFSTSGHRPQEALVPFAIDSAIRQVNNFTRSPLRQRGRRARMASVVITGDLADSNQRNEARWVRRVLEGGRLRPNSGTGELSGSVCGSGAPLDEPRNYTGVQDYDDYQESPLFYDPDRPLGQYGAWPSWPGLLDRAQGRFRVQGLDVPSYIAAGNHDFLVQGNEDALATYEELATGCLKPAEGPFPNVTRPQDTLSPAYLQGLLASEPDKVMQVPPDSRRQYVDRAQYKSIFGQGRQDDDHGFARVSRAEEEASAGSAAYYSVRPRPGVRLIALDSNAQGGGFLVGPGGDPVSVSSEGNLDDPQFRWLEGQLQRASERGELVVTFAHHGLSSMTYDVPDELAAPCSARDEHGHDVNPGCDSDPRSSTPIHTGEEVEALFQRYPNVIAHVAGHSHDNKVTAYPRESGGGFWEIRTPAIADWPSQARLLEIMDNRDGTLSIFGTLLDTAAPLDVPRNGASAEGFRRQELAALARTITYNDPQAGPGSAEGEPEDRNVELLIDDPRG